MLDQNIMSRNVGAADYYYVKDGAFPTYDFSTDQPEKLAGVGGEAVVEYYYDNSRDRFANRKAWMDLESDIVRVMVDPDLKASEIDVIFDLVYADRKRQIASMWKG
jgi:hypothetical protein